ncbi:uncharacterized protein LOC134278011 [Saccostrea cucullata]|uniref:uncharacterized protein LOC134278011 n=1 Tax=Saccostrea cuccullata TaxID=36930 RepID=UPI002ED45357
MGVPLSKEYNEYKNIAQHSSYSRDLIAPSLGACVPFLETVSHLSSENCCISYKLQSSCIGDRHFHASIQKKGLAAFLTVIDITHRKTNTICDIQTQNEIIPLPKKLLQYTDLQICNVVGLHYEWLVVQIFCQDGIKFLICDISTNTCLVQYTHKYVPQSKLKLYECHISPDRMFLVLKQNQLYQSLYNSNIEDGESVILLNIHLQIGTCTEEPCELLHSFISLALGRVAMTFDPRTDSDLIVYTSEMPDKLNREIYKGHIGLYKASRDSFLCTTGLLNQDFPALPGKFLNLQFLRDGSAIVLAVLGSVSPTRTISILCRNNFVTVYVLDPDCFQRTGSFSYVSHSQFQHFAPVISPSGTLACCAGKIYNIEHSRSQQNSVKSLKRLCYNVIVDFVLPEDIEHLPLPKSLKSYLR